jgi:hypothetical protein
MFLIPFILASVLCVDKNINNPFKLFIPAVILLVYFFAGLQNGLGDYTSYKFLYNNYSFEHFGIPFFDKFDGVGTGHEFIYTSLATLFFTVGLPFSVFFIFIVFFTVGIKLLWLKKHSSYFFISLLIYLSFIFIKDMTQIRAQVASSIIFLATYFIVNKKPIKYIFMVLLASGFHIFAITAFPLYLISKIKNHNKVIPILLLLTFIISLSGGLITLIVDNFSYGPLSFIQLKVSRLQDSSLNHAVNPFGFGIIFLVTLAIYGLYKWDEIKNSRLVQVVFLYYVYGLMGYLLFSDLGLLAFRFMEMFSHLSLAIILPFYIKISTYKMKLVMYFITIVYSLYFLILKVNATQEYDNILFS